MKPEVLNELTPSYVFGMTHDILMGSKGVIDETRLFFSVADFRAHIQRFVGIGANEDAH